MAVNRVIRVIRAKDVVAFRSFSPPPADNRSPEIRPLISGEMMALNSAIRVIRAKEVLKHFCHGLHGLRGSFLKGQAGLRLPLQLPALAGKKMSMFSYQSQKTSLSLFIFIPPPVDGMP